MWLSTHTQTHTQFKEIQMHGSENVKLEDKMNRVTKKKKHEVVLKDRVNEGERRSRW